jgi:hypothetical protein
MDKKIALIYHSADADGYLSALLFSEVCRLTRQATNLTVELTLFPYNYEHDVAFTSELIDGNFTDVVFADVTPPADWLVEMSNQHFQDVTTVTIFDHHSSKFNEINHRMIDTQCRFNYIYTEKDSASKIIFDYFWMDQYGQNLRSFFNIDMNHNYLQLSDYPYSMNAVKLVDRFDSWKWWDDFIKINDERPNVYYIGLFDRINELSKNSEQSTNTYLTNVCKHSSLEVFFWQHDDAIINNGGMISNKEKAIAKSLKIKKKSNFVVIANGVNSYLQKRVIEEFPDVDYALYYRPDSKTDPEMMKLSLRSVNLDYNVAEHAKKIFGPGSGGHANSAGARCTGLQLFTYLNSDGFAILEQTT